MAYKYNDCMIAGAQLEGEVGVLPALFWKLKKSVLIFLGKNLIVFLYGLHFSFKMLL